MLLDSLKLWGAFHRGRCFEAEKQSWLCRSLACWQYADQVPGHSKEHQSSCPQNKTVQPPYESFVPCSSVLVVVVLVVAVVGGWWLVLVGWWLLGCLVAWLVGCSSCCAIPIHRPHGLVGRSKHGWGTMSMSIHLHTHKTSIGVQWFKLTPRGERRDH